jgi:hypothetical protein
MADKRKEPRQSIDYPCWLDLGPGQPPIERRLSNISSSGAKLICDDGIEIADKFTLYLTRDGKVGRQCKVVRREENAIGLLFVSRDVPKPQWIDPVVVES